MLNKKILTAFVAASLLVGSIGLASAATLDTSTVIYYSESGQIVGQQILLCDNVAEHAGNIHTAYQVTIGVLCNLGSPWLPPYPPGGPAGPHYIVPQTYITNYVLPASETIQEACGEILGGCESAPNRQLNQGWTLENGWD